MPLCGRGWVWCTYRRVVMIITSSENKALASAEKVLRSQGKRITAQRALLLQIIRESKGHLDADQIYRLAREEDPHLSLSTVYRTLNLLKEVDLIAELYFDEEHRHYEIKDATEHYHLICSACGRIIEFKSPLMRQLKEEASRENDFEIHGVHIDLSGLCARCRAATD